MVIFQIQEIDGFFERLYSSINIAFLFYLCEIGYNKKIILHKADRTP